MSTEEELGGSECCEAMICGKGLKNGICVTYSQECFGVVIRIAFASPLKGFWLEDDAVLPSTDPGITGESSHLSGQWLPRGWRSALRCGPPVALEDRLREGCCPGEFLFPVLASALMISALLAGDTTASSAITL